LNAKTGHFFVQKVEGDDDPIEGSGELCIEHPGVFLHRLVLNPLKFFD
jgi:hypothetical protein